MFFDGWIALQPSTALSLNNAPLFIMPTIISTSSSSHGMPQPYYYTPSSSSSSSSHRSSTHKSSPPVTPGTFADYAPTTVSGYNARIAAVKGMPNKDYFNNGDSKMYRSKEFVTRPTAPSTTSFPRDHRRESSRVSSPASYASTPSRGRARRRDSGVSFGGGGGVGKEMVKYRSGHSGCESPDEDDDEDRRTIMPCDSISQVSSNPARRSSRGGGSYAGSSSFSNMSTIRGGRVWNHDLGCWTEVREPRMSGRREPVC